MEGRNNGTEPKIEYSCNEDILLMQSHQLHPLKKCWVRRLGETATWPPLGGQLNSGDRHCAKCHRLNQNV